VTLTSDPLTLKLVHWVLVSQGPFLPSLVFVGLFVFPLGGGTGQTDRQTDGQHQYMMGPPSRKDDPKIIPWEFSTHQLASSWLILEEESQLILARLERPVICFRGFLFWCSASMLFCCTTVCQLLTARTDDRTHLCIA